jgi:hypothetical protein
MSVGYYIGKGDIDLMLGAVAVDVREILTRGNRHVSCLANITDAQLENMGYTAADVTIIRNVAADILTLEQIITGQASLATVRDFTANLRQLYGAN